MLLPIGDTPNPRGVPAATYLLIAVNVAVYVLVSMPLEGVRPHPGDPRLAEYVGVLSRAIHDPAELRSALSHVSAYDLFVFSWGFRPAAPSLADLFASMFLHAGLMHLAGNMLFLWIYGDNVEYRLGPVGFVAAYLATGAVATAFHALGAPDSQIPMVGASGAISGVLGFYFVWFPRNRVRLLWLLPPFLLRVFEVPARFVLGVYLLLDNLLPYLLSAEGAGIAHGAHIGGFVAGVGAAWLMDRRALGAGGGSYGASAVPDVPVADRSARVARAIEDGRVDDAAAEYFALSTAASRGLLSPSHSLALARWLLANGHGDAALVVARRHLRDFPRGPGRAEAHLVAAEALLAARQVAPAYQHLQEALDQDPDLEIAARARRALAAIEAMQKRRLVGGA